MQLFAISAPVRAHILVVPPLDIKQYHHLILAKTEKKLSKNISSRAISILVLPVVWWCYSKASSYNAMVMKMWGSLCPVRVSAVSSLTQAEKMVKCKKEGCVGSLEESARPQPCLDGTVLMEWHRLSRSYEGFSQALVTIPVLPRRTARGSGDDLRLVLNLNNTMGW